MDVHRPKRLSEGIDPYPCIGGWEVPQQIHVEVFAE